MIIYVIDSLVQSINSRAIVVNLITSSLVNSYCVVRCTICVTVGCYSYTITCRYCCMCIFIICCNIILQLFYINSICISYASINTIDNLVTCIDTISAKCYGFTIGISSHTIHSILRCIQIITVFQIYTVSFEMSINVTIECGHSVFIHMIMYRICYRTEIHRAHIIKIGIDINFVFFSTIVIVSCSNSGVSTICHGVVLLGFQSSII